MKKFFILIVILCGSYLEAIESPLSSPPKTSTNPGTTPNKNNSSKENWIKDQNDQTDTYAIPLDDSEEEEKEEEKILENMKRR